MSVVAPSRVGIALMGAVLFAACGSGDTLQEAIVRRDSAGVEVVSNPDVSAEESGWGEVMLPPLVSIGSERAGPALFGRIGRVRLAADGSLWIPDVQARELRVFDVETGSHLFTVGGHGDGPGEYRALRLLGFDGGGAAHVYDDLRRRLTVYAKSGAMMKETSILVGEGFPPVPMHVTPDGSLLGRIPRLSASATPRAAEGIVRDTTRVWLIDPAGGEPKLVAESLGPLWYYSGSTQVPVPFDGGAMLGFLGDRVYMTDAHGQPSFGIYGLSGLERRVEVRRDRDEMDGVGREYLEILRQDGWPRSRVSFYEEHVADMPVPPELPMWDEILVADEGDVWLRRTRRRRTVEDTWDVFGRDGRVAGAVRVPSEVSIHQVTRSHIVGTLANDLDVRVAVVLAVRWPSCSRLSADRHALGGDC